MNAERDGERVVVAGYGVEMVNVVDSQDRVAVRVRSVYL